MWRLLRRSRSDSVRAGSRQLSAARVSTCRLEWASFRFARRPCRRRCCDRLSNAQPGQHSFRNAAFEFDGIGATRAISTIATPTIPTSLSEMIGRYINVDFQTRVYSDCFNQRGSSMSIRPVKRVHSIKTDDRRRWRSPPARLRLWRHARVRPVPPVRRLPQRHPRRIPAGISVASASRDRNDHLCAGRHGRSWGQPWKSRDARGWRRAMDDRGKRDHSSGNAQGRSAGEDARIPALGESACRSEDDRRLDIRTSREKTFPRWSMTMEPGFA